MYLSKLFTHVTIISTMTTAKSKSNDGLEEPIPLTSEELESEFDLYLDRVQNGEHFLIDGKVVLTKVLEEPNSNV